MKKRLLNSRNFVAYSVAVIILGFIVNTGMSSYAQTRNKKKNEIEENTSFKRPEPQKPITPEVPAINRYQEDKVFLEYADSLYKVNNYFDTVEKQILKGNVKFRQAGLWMYCDSAYYYPTQNSLDAFSNVKMEQGDTLFVYADKLFYNGDEHLAKLLNGPTRNKVKLINKDVTLTTDSLDYDVAMDLGWYTRWGTIDDKVNTLTSLYGEYSPRTKKAEFYHDVVLINNKDGYRLLTDTLHYSTATHIANIESRTEIQSSNDTIITNLATYYTDSGDADLLSRSMIIHRDSNGNVTTLEGDSIIYNNQKRISKAYMFRSPSKRPTPMVINDTAQKTKLIGGFGIYNDSTKEAMATYYPLLIEYSRNDDTLFLRADIIRTYIVSEMIAEKKKKSKSGYPEYNGLPIVMPLENGLWIDSAFFKVEIPYIDTPLTMLLKAAPPYKKENNEKVTIEENEKNSVIEDIIDSFEILNDSLSLNDSVPGLIKEGIIEENKIEIPMPEGLGLMNELTQRKTQKSTLEGSEISLNNQTTDSLTQDSLQRVDSILYESHVIMAYHRGRFFKKDMQGVADSMVFIEKDSMLYLFRKPIVWSGERQVTGNRIDVHFNDSTSDWAFLPEFGLISEHVEEDFYNQITGREIKAYFENQGLRRMNVEGNVETIFLPQEEDSTYNRLVYAESSFMEAYMDSTKLDWLKMWPEVNGTVTPLFMVKRNQMYLQKFRWWDFLRPERAWYGNQMIWADNLGELPDDLEQYFESPSDFGEPKSFPGQRGTLPGGIIDYKNFDITPDDVPKEEILELDGETLEDIEKNEELEEIKAEEIGSQTEEIEKATEEEQDNLQKEDAIIKEEGDE